MQWLNTIHTNPNKIGWYATIKDDCPYSDLSFEKYCLEQYQPNSSYFDGKEWREGYKKVDVIAWLELPTIPKWVYKGR